MMTSFHEIALTNLFETNTGIEKGDQLKRSSKYSDFYIKTFYNQIFNYLNIMCTYYKGKMNNDI